MARATADDQLRERPATKYLPLDSDGTADIRRYPTERIAASAGSRTWSAPRGSKTENIWTDMALRYASDTLSNSRGGDCSAVPCLVRFGPLRPHGGGLYRAEYLVYKGS